MSQYRMSVKAATAQLAQSGVEALTRSVVGPDDVHEGSLPSGR
jgi:hypothetical protein